ncbi:MAG: serine hydrolase [Gammaproteobacteria bacterium]|nr:MAG: serine hydrolase [Gammaproteobacteria bacterium]
MSLSRRQLLAYGAMGALTPMGAWAQPSELQYQLNALIRQMRQQGRISPNERTAWSVYDFNSRQKLVSINEYSRLQAASMVKVFVALAYFFLHQRSPYQYPYGWKEQQVMQKMLVKSSNTATNQVMGWCGGPSRIAALCQQATGNRFLHLHIVEYIPKGGRTYRNRAAAIDYSRFFYDLWHGKLPMAHELKRLLSMENHDRITTEQMGYDVTIYDKTGSTGMLCGDAGIVQVGYGGHNAYTFIGILERGRKAKSYGPWITARSKMMREVSDLVFSYMTDQYRYVPKSRQQQEPIIYWSS